MLLEMSEDLDAYYWHMAARGRLVAIDEGRVGLLTFFLLQDDSEVHQFYCRPLWSTPEDHEGGTLVYIDRLFVRGPFTLTLARSIEAAIAAACPQYTRAIWHRPSLHGGPDRRYTFTRRR